MPTPIRHATTAPPAPPATPAIDRQAPEEQAERTPAPATHSRTTPFTRAVMPSGEKRPAASVGRGDSHAGRSPADGSLRDDAISADGLFFSQLLVPPVSEEPDQQSFAGGSLDFTTKTEPVPAQLIDELSQRLPQQPVGPLNFTLLMPNLGQVRVNAEKTDNRWNIQLGFSRRDVLKRVNGQASACRDALAQALGHDVDLDFHEDLDA